MLNLRYFDEFDNTEIRCTEDGCYSIFDVILFCDTKNPRNVWERFCKRYPEVARKCKMYKFSGRGQRETPVAKKAICDQILKIIGKHPEQSPVTSDKFYPRAESQIIAVLMESFQDLSPVPQFRVHGYRIDLYLATANIAIEIDENGHTAYPSNKELARQKAIKSALGCSFVRFDPYAVDFNLGRVIRQIRGLL
jgi:very-short-patch-repair endonuclease